MTTETKETAKDKGSKPTDEIFPVGSDGKPNYKGRIAAWKAQQRRRPQLLDRRNALRDVPGQAKARNDRATRNRGEGA